MAYLGDYLGQLLSEIALARFQADLETVRLAELYAAHPLLRTMPVPHVRLPDVDLQIPVLIEASDEPRHDEPTRGGVSPADMRRAFDEVLNAHMARAGIALTPARKKKLRVLLDERLERTDLPKEISVDVQRVADELASTAGRFLDELRSASKDEESTVPPTFAGDLGDAVRLEFLRLRPRPPRVSVLVTSTQIREAGTPENITHLRLKVAEQGVEWASIESDGVRRDLLVPE